jgi:tetratricopeptide (TPR) repeat protein
VSKAQHARIYVSKGRALEELGRIDEALSAFNQAIEIFPHASNDAYLERTRLRTLEAR